jgi:rubrerythrin
MGYVRQQYLMSFNMPTCIDITKNQLKLYQSLSFIGRREPMSISPKDLQNTTTTLNLEYGATQRYIYQVENLTHPGINSLLEGLRRNEADHIDMAVAKLKEALPEEDKKGFATALLHLRMNLEFERIANKTYAEFMRNAESPEMKELFRDLMRSEAGHVGVIKDVIDKIEKGEYPVLFYCPVCGWELNYGPSPEVGAEVRCAKCGQTFALGLQDGDFVITKAS